MIDFLKNFFGSEKSADERELLASQKKRDVITIETGEEEQPKSGCGGCGCGR